MSLPELLKLGVIVISFPLTGLTAALLLWLTLKDPRFKTLRAHAFAALALIIIVAVFAAVFVANDMTVPPLTLAQTQIITRATLFFVPTAASLYWLLFIWRSS